MAAGWSPVPCHTPQMAGDWSRVPCHTPQKAGGWPAVPCHTAQTGGDWSRVHCNTPQTAGDWPAVPCHTAQTAGGWQTVPCNTSQWSGFQPPAGWLNPKPGAGNHGGRCGGRRQGSCWRGWSLLPQSAPWVCYWFRLSDPGKPRALAGFTSMAEFPRRRLAGAEGLARRNRTRDAPGPAAAAALFPSSPRARAALSRHGTADRR